MDDALYSLVTEQQNEHSLNIDIMDTIDVLKIMNDEDKKVAYAVEECLDDITLAVDKIVERMKKGGRLLYLVRTSIGGHNRCSRMSYIWH